MPKPSIFIGSSSEGLVVAQALQEQLERDATVTLWTEGVFGLGETYIESLTNAADNFDFAILVFRADDTLTSKGITSTTTRGNVLFELGLFMGRLGRFKTFVVYDSSAKPTIISDLEGVTFAPFDGAASGNFLSALGSACNKIRRAIKNFDADYKHSPELRVKLRKVGEWAWSLRGAKLISNWIFELHFHVPNEKTAGSLLNVEGFSVYEVKKCQYSLLLPSEPFRLGMIFGEIDTHLAWQKNPAYLHQIYIEALKEAERNRISRLIHEKVRDPNVAWNAFFENVQIRIREEKDNKYYNLIPATPESGYSYVTTSFSIPEEARGLIGKEVVLDLSFRSIWPTALCDFTLEFPWLTYKCDAHVIIHGELEYLITSPSFWGDKTARVEKQPYGDGYKVWVNADDLVLPGSSVPIRWCAKEGGNTMNHVGGGGKKGARKGGGTGGAKKGGAKKGGKKGGAKKGGAKKRAAKK